MGGRILNANKNPVPSSADLLAAAVAVRHTYSPQLKEKQSFKGYFVERVLNKGASRVVVMKNSHSVIVSCIMKVAQEKPLMQQFQQSSVYETASVDIGGNSMKVLKVLWEQLQMLEDNLLNNIRKEIQSGMKLILTGHSMGGAMAQLMALKMYYSDTLPLTNYWIVSFGSPRVGNPNFATVTDNIL